MALLLKHQTRAQFIARLRTAYAQAEGERVIQLARYIVAAIQRGDLTDTELRTAWGLNTTGWNTLKTKMNSLITAANTVKAAMGE